MKKILLVLMSLIFALNLNAQTEEYTASITTPSAGWYRVAYFPGVAGRTFNEFTIFTNGGAYVPVATKITIFKDWSSGWGLTINNISPHTYWTEARITTDAKGGYLELYFTKEIIAFTYLKRIGWARGGLYANELPAGGGTIIGTSKIQTFNLSNKFVVNFSGNVGIGTTKPGAKLDVNGKIRAEEIEIVSDVPASDYVFEKEYELLNLDSLNNFVKHKKHLPGVPSAEEYKHKGYKVGQMDDLLLRKIEELTLYIIAQEKRIKELEKKN